MRRLFPSLCALFLMAGVHADPPENATAGLYLCLGKDGVTNIVSARRAASLSGCRPYRRGALGGGDRETLPPRPAPSLFPDDGGPMPRRIPLKGQSFAPVAKKKPEPSPAPVQKKTPATGTKDTFIFICPAPGGDNIIKAHAAPDRDCRRFTGKARPKKEAVSLRQAPPPPVTGKSANSPGDTVASDIYKCFDRNGRPSYVATDKRDTLRHCTFFSRSFAGAGAAFRKSVAGKAKSLVELAVAGIGLTADPKRKAPGLKCVGQGEIRFNGSSRVYDCATRSFEYTPGSSGGQVALGRRQAEIAAHRFDYFDTGGSCGGTVTSANGRVLHFAPTKSCPSNVLIAARRIAAAYLKTLSIQVNGAFLERRRALAAQVNRIAQAVGVDPFLVHAVISAESAYRSHATSKAGAQGLMQLMPATARRFGVADAYHSGENIRGGTTYLKWLLKTFNGNMRLAIAGYHAGEGNVRKYGYRIPPFIETRAYVPKVMQYYRRYQKNPALIGLKPR